MEPTTRDLFRIARALNTTPGTLVRAVKDDRYINSEHSRNTHEGRDR